MQKRANYVRALGALFALWGADYPAAYEGAQAAAVDGLAAPAPPSAAVRRRLEDEVLTLGALAATLPVESLYKPWASMSGGDGGGPAQFGAARNLLLGDSAQHMRALYGGLELEVPPAYEAMPDHVVLLTEVACLYAETGNGEAVRALLADHLDWLSAYEEALATRLAALKARPLPVARHHDELTAALAHGRELTGALTRAIHNLSQSLR